MGKGMKIGKAVMGGLSEALSNIVKMRQDAALMKLKEQQANRTSAQKDFEYMNKLPEGQRPGFVQLAQTPTPYGVKTIPGGYQPIPAPIIGHKATPEDRAFAASERAQAAISANKKPNPQDLAIMKAYQATQVSKKVKPPEDDEDVSFE